MYLTLYLHSRRQTLKQKYDTTVAGLAQLRQEHAARRQEEQELLAQLTELETDLGSFIQIPPAPITTEESTISPLPRSYLQSLKSEMDRGTAELQTRSQTLQETLTDIVEMWSAIHTPPRPGHWFDAMICTHMQLKPQYVSLHDEAGQLTGYAFRGDFDRFLNDQGRFDVFAPPDAVPTQLEGGPTPLPARLAATTEHLNQASALYDALLTEKTEREQYIQDVYDELSTLWMEFDVPRDEMEAFVQDNRGSTLLAVQAYEEEMRKMKQHKRDNMAEFIARGWDRIMRLCDRARITAEECYARFPLPEFNGNLEGPGGGEDILAQQAEIVELLSEETDKKVVLLDTVTKYQQVLQEEKEMEERAKDPNRFKNTRGGAMLREEKMRKRVKVLKPKLEQELLREIPLWEEQYQQTFTIDGAPYLHTLQAAISQQQEEAAYSKRSRNVSTMQTPSVSRPRTAMSRPGTAMGRPGTAMDRPGTAMGRPGTAMGTRTVPSTPMGRPGSPSRIGSTAASAMKRQRVATGASMAAAGTPSMYRAAGTRAQALHAGLDTPTPLPTSIPPSRSYASSSGSSAASTLAAWTHRRTESVSSSATTCTSVPHAPAPIGGGGFKPRPSVKLETYERRGGRRSGLPSREDRDAMRWADEEAEALDEDVGGPPAMHKELGHPSGREAASSSRAAPYHDHHSSPHGTLAPVQPVAPTQQGRNCSVVSNATIITHPVPAPSDTLRLSRPPSPDKRARQGSPQRSGIPVPSRTVSPVRASRFR